MVRTARERVTDLFALAEREGSLRRSALADRYVGLARKVGMRYNVRIPREYRELYCRRCSAHWIEGRSVRTRIRRSGRVRTCLRCGWVRRSRVGGSLPDDASRLRNLRLGSEPTVALAGEGSGFPDSDEMGEEED